MRLTPWTRMAAAMRASWTWTPEMVFDDPRSPVGIRGRQAKAVAIQRPCQNVPEFAHVLRGAAGKGARTNKRIDGTIHEWLQGVAGLEPADKNVAVEQYAHGRPMGGRRRCLRGLGRSPEGAAGALIRPGDRQASYGNLRP